MALTDKLTNIGNAIREKTNTEDLIPLADMPQKVNQVYESGKQSEYDRFWDDFQSKGKRYNYTYAFAGGGWNKDTFKPVYTIRPTMSAAGIFAYCNDYNAEPIDFTEINQLLDFSAVSSVVDGFRNAYVINLDLDLSNITNVGRLFYSNTYPQYCPNYIALKVSDICIGWSETFSYCVNLTHLIFKEGSVISRSVDIGMSPLNKESIISVINALSSTETERKLTLKASAVNNAFETSDNAGDGSVSEEWAALIATKQNWTIALA